MVSKEMTLESKRSLSSLGQSVNIVLILLIIVGILESSGTKMYFISEGSNFNEASFFVIRF